MISDIFISELDGSGTSGSYGDGSSSTLPMRGKLPTSGLNGHAHHAPHCPVGQDAEIAKLRAFVKHLQVSSRLSDCLSVRL